MYEELAAIREVVNLSAQSVLDEAETFLVRLGYVTLRRTDTSLWVRRDQLHHHAGDGVLTLTVIAMPQPGGGVQVKVRGNDQEGVLERQDEWREWMESFPKKEPEEANETAPSDQLPHQPTNGTLEEETLNALSEELGFWPPGPGEESEAQVPTEEHPDAPLGMGKQLSSPAPYEYKMIQLSPTFAVQEEEYGEGDEIARYLQSVANEQAEQGWEFYRLDEFAVADKPRRLAALFGAVGRKREYYVATFRRPK